MLTADQKAGTGKQDSATAAGPSTTQRSWTASGSGSRNRALHHRRSYLHFSTTDNPRDFIVRRRGPPRRYTRSMAVRLARADGHHPHRHHKGVPRLSALPSPHLRPHRMLLHLHTSTRWTWPTTARDVLKKSRSDRPAHDELGPAPASQSPHPCLATEGTTLEGE